MNTGRSQWGLVNFRHGSVNPGLLVLVCVFMLLSVSAVSAVTWENFKVFNKGSPQGMPYASNGPGCSMGTMGVNPQPGTNCPGNNQVYDLGAVWVDMDDTYVAWMIMAPNLTNAQWCNPAASLGNPFTSPPGVGIGIEIDVDNNISTGCNANNTGAQNCFPGSEYQVWFYGDNTTAFMKYNASLASCSSGGSCFSVNNSITVSKNMSCGPFPSIVMLAVNRSALVGLKGTNFEANSFATGAGPVEHMGGYGQEKMMMGGSQDPMMMGQTPCMGFTTNAACTNVSMSYKCTWNSNFNKCEPNFALGGGMNCSDFCGMCNSTVTCQNGGRGKCQIVNAPPSPRPPDMRVWSDSGDKVCVENMQTFQMGTGGSSGSCDTDCKFCASSSTCSNSRVPNSMGGGAGCQWVTDPVFGGSWCDLATFSTNSLRCSAASPDRCLNQTACQGAALTWSDAITGNSTNCTNIGGSVSGSHCSIIQCYTPGQEICYDGIDNNNNSLIDCAESSCQQDKFCGGDINMLTDATVVARGGADLTRGQAMQFQMFKDMDPSPPVMLYGIASTPSVAGHLDITGFDIKDMGNSLAFGIKVRNYTSIECSGGYVGTGSYYYLLDTDKNSSTGCIADIAGTNYTGFEYKLIYNISMNSSGGIVEVRTAERCMGGQFFVQPIKLAGAPTPPPEMNMGSQKMSCVFGVALVAVDKVDIGNSLSIRIMAATSDNTTTLTTANKTILGPNNGGMYYTPGTIDFKPQDCQSNPTACGTAFSMIGGGKFMPFEDCMKPGDEDMNSLSDCADPACQFAPFCAGRSGSFNSTTDTSAPTVPTARADTFKDFVFLHWVTNEPSNGTISLYESCSDATPLNYFVDMPPSEFDRYKPWHDFGIRNQSTDFNGATVVLDSNTTYYYKLTSCDRAGNCAVSACLNFTTKAGSASSAVQFQFDFTPPADPLVNGTTMKIWNGTAYQNITAGQLTNQSSYLQNATLKFDHPGTGSNNWSIAIGGIDLAQATSMDLSEAFNATNESGHIYVGMDNNKWLELAQTLGPENITITIPEGSNGLIKCQTDNMSNCADVTGNATKVAGGDGYNYTTWEIPIGLGFSVYGANSSDVDAPYWESLTVSPGNVINYSTGQTINLSIKWTDESSDLDAVLIEFNGTNYTMNGGGSGTYYSYTNATLAAGNYTYEFFVNDTQGNMNNTDEFALIITKNTSSCSVSTASSTLTYPNPVLVTASCSDPTAKLYRNATVQSNMTYLLLGAGDYVLVVNTTDRTNFTIATASAYVNVSKGIPTLYQNSSAGWSIAYTTATTLSAGGCPGTGAAAITCNLTLNDTNMGVSSLLINITNATGVYAIGVTSSGNENWSATTSTPTDLTITKATMPLYLYIDGYQLNKAINISTNSTITGSKPYDEGILDLYINGTVAATPGASLSNNSNYTSAGTYNLTLVYNATENFTASSATRYLTVYDFTPAAGQVIVTSETPEVTVDSSTTEVIVTDTSSLEDVTIPSTITSTTEVSLVYSFVSETNGADTDVTVGTDFNVSRSTSTVNYTLEIPANTTISGTGWDGVLLLPTVKAVTTVTISAPSGYTQTTSQVIEIGSTSVPLTFDKGVRIVMSGQANKSVGYTSAGSSTFTEITANCSVDTQENADENLSIGGVSACKINSGSDLVVWTKHFTKFATYTLSASTPHTTPTPPTTYSNTGGSSLGYTYPPVVTPPLVVTTPPPEAPPEQPPAQPPAVQPPANVPPAAPSTSTVAQQEITNAETQIAAALKKGNDISVANTKLASAKAAFANKDYLQAKELAQEAAQLALNSKFAAPPKTTPPAANISGNASATPVAPESSGLSFTDMLVIGAVVLVAILAAVWALFLRKQPEAQVPPQN
ncbi:Uncharacterised protein [Candidatus Gugararchaeum adminiculabundum]|nr:Uncharacterised protein [Candidatus Gugararchaeum adminiculabundum]